MVETLGILGNENLQGEAKFPALNFCQIFHADGYTTYRVDSMWVLYLNSCGDVQNITLTNQHHPVRLKIQQGVG
jgi:hypothetical protein